MTRRVVHAYAAAHAYAYMRMRACPPRGRGERPESVRTRQVAGMVFDPSGSQGFHRPAPLGPEAVCTHCANRGACLSPTGHAPTGQPNVQRNRSL